MHDSSNITRERYPDLPALFEAIRKRPGMFLGQTTIRGLLLFLEGIDFAEDYHGFADAARFAGFDRAAFEAWVDSTFNTKQLSLNSMALAEHVAGSDEAGFALWFQWYDAFRAQRSTQAD